VSGEDEDQEEVTLTMRTSPDELLKISLKDATERLKNLPDPFVELFRRGEFSVELFAPIEVDAQQPHQQDEAYIVASGSGIFLRDDEHVAFAEGDFLFVPAGVIHRFEQFSADFKTWVIFFGPKGGGGSKGRSE
jgi:mannose-6-phosphate isomerase-like protein (cupin superfamily)